jgi:hypothetical protein
MKGICCQANDIFEVNDKKEYTLLCTYIIEKTLKNKKLYAYSKDIWQYLYKQARFNNNLEIHISNKVIAKEFGKSIRTIQRYINSLIENGYLEIRATYKKRNNIISVFCIRVPLKLIDEIKNKENRKIYIPIQKTSKYNKKTENNVSRKFISYEKVKKRCSAQKFTQYDKIVASYIYNNNIYINNNIPSLKYLEFNNTKPFVVFSSKNKFEINFHSISQTHPYFKSAKTKTTSFPQQANVILENNLTKPFFKISSEKYNPKKLKEIKEKQLKSLKKHKAELNEAFLSESDQTKKFKKLQALGQVEADYECILHELKRLIQQTEEQKAIKVFQEKLQTDHMFISSIAKRKGNRLISKSAIKRISKTLELFGYKDKHKVQLINEIVFEVTFGSLVKSNFERGKNVENNIDRSINIALKLIREKRWNTPSQFYSKIRIQQHQSQHRFQAASSILCDHSLGSF